MDRDFLNQVSSLMRGKWTSDVLYIIYFLKEPYYNDLRNSLPKINSRTLTNRLITLKKFGMIERKVHQGQPVRVSYSLTPFGEDCISLRMPLLVYIALHMENADLEFKKIFGSDKYL
ncbi:MAG: winged helix-turn-helix transcriptional regulator [Promethearchaeota archaeon]